MTFREKLQEEYPESVSDKFVGGCEGCPSSYGYEKSTYTICALHCKDKECARCWDREIPGTETKRRVKTMAKKSIKNMTKAELMEELEKMKADAKEAEKRIEALKRYEAYETAADEIKALHDSLTSKGLSEHFADTMVLQLVGNVARSTGLFR